MSAYGRLAEERRRLAERLKEWRMQPFRNAEEAATQVQALYKLVVRLRALEAEMKGAS